MESLLYDTLFPVSSDSAERIVPVLLALFGPCERVLDLGGGVGAWCREFRKHGCRVTCIDGPHIRDEELVIDRTEFLAIDLSTSMPAPVDVDLALSLEFAEHVPPERAHDIVGFLTRSSPIVVFSASLPGQPGHRHVNERPALYWKELFAGMGFACLDLSPSSISSITATSAIARSSMSALITASMGSPWRAPCRRRRCWRWRRTRSTAGLLSPTLS